MILIRKSKEVIAVDSNGNIKANFTNEELDYKNEYFIEAQEQYCTLESKFVGK